MNKKIETYYAIIPVEERLPDDEKYYGTILKNGSFNNDYKSFDTGTTHWLSEQQGTILSVEEWEKMQSFIKEAELYYEYSLPHMKGHITLKNKFYNALSQLNTKP